MPKYKFLEDCELKQGDGLGPVYKAGEVYTLSVDHGERWKRRLKAEDYVDPNPVPSKFEASLIKPVPPHAEKIGAAMKDVDNLISGAKTADWSTIASVTSRPTKPTEEDA